MGLVEGMQATLERISDDHRPDLEEAVAGARSRRVRTPWISRLAT
jgi:hypothetical protein